MTANLEFCTSSALSVLFFFSNPESSWRVFIISSYFLSADLAADFISANIDFVESSAVLARKGISLFITLILSF